ncbi:inositol monophosphatase [Cellulomonas sp. APG4]|nr:inositol monophosphatase [Cellulomonas sp. APG4]
MQLPPAPAVDDVTALVERVAHQVVAPRFRALAAGDVSEKGPGDLVTVVDTEAERALAAGLAELAPGVPVVGEEAASLDARVLDALDAPRTWVVDPIDGTRAFVEGEPDYAVMVALVEHGSAVAGWICLPEPGETYVAERGAGAWVSGRRLQPAAAHEPLVGGVATSYLPPAVRAHLDARAPALGPRITTSERLWAGKAYADLAAGRRDVCLWWRTQPWDHAAGAVLVRESGGVSRRLDGSDYLPGTAGTGLLVSRTAEVDTRVRAVLEPDALARDVVDRDATA